AFKTRATNQEPHCDLDWAALVFGEREIMLSAGGAPGTPRRQSADLYIRTDDLENLRRQIPSTVEIVEDLHDTFYGMREFILRDPNGFGSPSANRSRCSGS